MNLKTRLYRQKEKYKRYLQRSKNGHCTVLLYHRVIDLKYDPQQLCVGVDQFAKQLEVLKQSNVFLDIHEFTHLLQNNKKFPKNALLISFDDGYADNYNNALPVLGSLNLPAVFYVSTAGIGTDNLMWWDELDLIFKKIKSENTDISALVKKHNVADTKSLYKYYLAKCKTAASLDDRNALLAEIRNIASLAAEDIKDHKMLTGEELKKLASSKQVVIGAHTVNHLSLAHINDISKKEEIENSVKALSVLGSKIEHFSFPYGEKINYDEKTIRICKELGLKSVSANYVGYVTKGSDLFSFPRFVVRNDAPDLLIQKMKEIL